MTYVWTSGCKCNHSPTNTVVRRLGTLHHPVLLYLFSALSFWRVQGIIYISYLHFLHSIVHVCYLTWPFVQTEGVLSPLDDWWENGGTEGFHWRPNITELLKAFTIPSYLWNCKRWGNKQHLPNLFDHQTLFEKSKSTIQTINVRSNIPRKPCTGGFPFITAHPSSRLWNFWACRELSRHGRDVHPRKLEGRPIAIQ